MLNTSAATDARHSRSGKDAMLYNADGVPFAQVSSFQSKTSFNNTKYQPLGQNRELKQTILLESRLQFRRLLFWMANYSTMLLVR